MSKKNEKGQNMANLNLMVLKEATRQRKQYLNPPARDLR